MSGTQPLREGHPSSISNWRCRWQRARLAAVGVAPVFPGAGCYVMSHGAICWPRLRSNEPVLGGQALRSAMTAPSAEYIVKVEHEAWPKALSARGWNILARGGGYEFRKDKKIQVRGAWSKGCCPSLLAPHRLLATVLSAFPVAGCAARGVCRQGHAPALGVRRGEPNHGARPTPAALPGPLVCGDFLRRAVGRRPSSGGGA